MLEKVLKKLIVSLMGNVVEVKRNILYIIIFILGLA